MHFCVRYARMKQVSAKARKRKARIHRREFASLERVDLPARDRWWWTACALLVAAALLRLLFLTQKPLHHDEGVNGVFLVTLFRTGFYHYDPANYHGPTLYYLTLPSAWLRGQSTLASLNESTLRAVPVFFGAATILLLALLSSAIGRTAAAAGALLMALSPAMVFYSRMFIQESLFACFTLAFVIALGRAATDGRTGWFIAAGSAGGLAVATKETAAIVLLAALVACAIASSSGGSALAWRRRLLPGLVGVVVAIVIAALFYSSFFSAPDAMLGPLRGAGTYLDRGIDPAAHVHPWHYYLRVLAYHSDGGLRWSEGLVLVLAATGAVLGWTQKNIGTHFWVRYLSLYVLIAAAIFSAIPYKTPWNLLPFYAGVFAIAGIGFATLVQTTSSRVVRAVLVMVVLLASAQLDAQAWRASVVYAADPRNPYVYVQTVPDAVRMAARIRGLSAVHADGAAMQVSVIAPPHEQWPLPWYLRSMPNVGYWAAPGDPLALQAPVIVSSMDHTSTLDRELGDRYVSEFFGLRPDVLLALYIDRGLWDRFLAKTAANTSTSLR